MQACCDCMRLHCCMCTLFLNCSPKKVPNRMAVETAVLRLVRCSATGPSEPTIDTTSSMPMDPRCRARSYCSAGNSASGPAQGSAAGSGSGSATCMRRLAAPRAAAVASVNGVCRWCSMLAAPPLHSSTGSRGEKRATHLQEFRRHLRSTLHRRHALPLPRSPPGTAQQVKRAAVGTSQRFQAALHLLVLNAGCKTLGWVGKACRGFPCITPAVCGKLFTMGVLLVNLGLVPIAAGWPITLDHCRPLTVRFGLRM